MAKSKKVKRVHICPTCKGNGYIKIQNIYDVELQVHQCWDCDSEGEFYEVDDMGWIDDGTSDSVH